LENQIKDLKEKVTNHNSSIKTLQDEDKKIDDRVVSLT
jgi:hypothetical protein